jgi:hypothetical protein
MRGSVPSRAVDATVIDLLARFGGRGACTDAERRAAAALHDELRARGHEAWVEARWIRPQATLSLFLHAALAVAGSLVSVTLPLAGAIAAGVAALSLAVEATGRPGLLRLAFPRRATQHVLTVPEAGRVALIVSARYDVPRGGLARSALLQRIAARLPGRPLAWLAGCCAAVAAASAARAAGVEGAWLGALQLVPTLVLLGAIALAVDAMAAGWADHDASGAAVAIALHDELARRPPGELAPALLLHGAGAPGPQALRAHLRGERARARDTVVIEVGPCGAGAPAWATRHSQLRTAAARAGDALDLRSARIRQPSGTGRLPALVIGTAGAPGPVDHATLDAVVDLALAAVDALDADLSRARSPA